MFITLELYLLHYILRPGLFQVLKATETKTSVSGLHCVLELLQSALVEVCTR